MQVFITMASFLSVGLSEVTTLPDESYTIEYLVKSTGEWRNARILAQSTEVADMEVRRDGHSYLLAQKDDGQWILDPRVHGEIRPFSMSVSDAGTEIGKVEPILTIRDHLFQHRGRFYIFGSIPEGRAPGEFLTGSKYISRLDNFPHVNLTEVDHHTRSMLRRAFRGVLVGEFGGLGSDGHLVRLSGELEDIGLFLAACSYLLFSTR
jgi:hypothetical protein